MKMNTTKESGFTLVELLVALLIGLLLAAAIVTIYLGSQTTFRAAQGVSRSQEATRFAVHFLKTDIRQAGYIGCSDGVSKHSSLNALDPGYTASFDAGIFGWEFAGTGRDATLNLTYAVESGDSTNADIDAARAANSPDASMWTSRIVDSAASAQVNVTALPAVISNLSPLTGSDIVSITISEPILDGNDQPLYVSAITNQRSLNLGLIDFNGNVVNGGSNVANGAILSIGDCSSVDTFQNTAVTDANIFSIDPGATLSPGNLLTDAFQWQKRWDESASLFKSVTSVYFIGTGASGIPSLFRYSSDCGLIDDDGGPAATACNVSVSSLVEGVENMQVMYGEDTNDDGVPNQVLAADQVGDFDDVVSVELGLLVRSVDSGLDNNNITTYVLAGNTSVNPSNPNDRFQRFVSNTTIRLHNQGL